MSEFATAGADVAIPHGGDMSEAELNERRDRSVPAHVAAAILKESEKTRLEMATRAKYKVQIWFQSTRSDRKPVAFTLSVWESGKRLHGGGDECMFICRRHRDAPKPFDVVGVSNPQGCGGFIPGGITSPGGVVICPHCSARHRTHDIGDSIFYRVTAQKGAEILTDWWSRLNGDADIVAKYAPFDIRVKMIQEAEGMRRARELKGTCVYPLARIIRDSAQGADITSRFKAFILA